MTLLSCALLMSCFFNNPESAGGRSAAVSLCATGLSGKAVGGKTVGIEQSYSAANGGTQTVTVKNLVKYAEQTYGNCTNENLFGGNNSAVLLRRWEGA